LIEMESRWNAMTRKLGSRDQSHGQIADISTPQSSGVRYLPHEFALRREFVNPKPIQMRRQRLGQSRLVGLPQAVRSLTNVMARFGEYRTSTLPVCRACELRVPSLIAATCSGHPVTHLEPGQSLPCVRVLQSICRHVPPGLRNTGKQPSSYRVGTEC
jgi:alkylated DNA nucleotide flippase Atl1